MILFSPVGLEPLPIHEEVVSPRKVSFRAAAAVGLLQSNYTPQGLIRAFGHLGKERVHVLVARRFGSDRWSTTESEVISDYLYHISALPRAGEDALNGLLQLLFVKIPSTSGEIQTRPKCLARKPLAPMDFAGFASPKFVALEERSKLSATELYNSQSEFDEVKDSKVDNSSSNVDSVVRSGIPILLMYGDYDWMHFHQAKKFIEDLNTNFGVNASFKLIRNAGHHLYMDNAGHFHSVIDTWLQENFTAY